MCSTQPGSLRLSFALALLVLVGFGSICTCVEALQWPPITNAERQGGGKGKFPAAYCDGKNGAPKEEMTWAEVSPHLHIIHSFLSPNEWYKNKVPAVSGNLVYPLPTPGQKPHSPLVHTTIGDLVFGHRDGNWECHRAAVIIPFAQVVARIYAGNEQDLMLFVGAESEAMKGAGLKNIEHPVFVIPSGSVKAQTDVQAWLGQIEKSIDEIHGTVVKYDPPFKCTETNEFMIKPGEEKSYLDYKDMSPPEGPSNKKPFETLRDAVNRVLDEKESWFPTKCPDDNQNYDTKNRNFFKNPKPWPYPPFDRLCFKPHKLNCAVRIKDTPADAWHLRSGAVHIQSKLGQASKTYDLEFEKQLKNEADLKSEKAVKAAIKPFFQLVRKRLKAQLDRYAEVGATHLKWTPFVAGEWALRTAQYALMLELEKIGKVFNVHGTFEQYKCVFKDSKVVTTEFLLHVVDKHGSIAKKDMLVAVGKACKEGKDAEALKLLQAYHDAK